MCWNNWNENGKHNNKIYKYKKLMDMFRERIENKFVSVGKRKRRKKKKKGKLKERVARAKMVDCFRA